MGKYQNTLFLCIVVIAAVLLPSRKIFHPEVFFPDADRLALDGVFLYDAFRDLPLDPYQYTIQYYAQYPGLSIGFKPPFYPFLESIFTFLLGPSVPVHRFPMLILSLLGFWAFFLTVRRIFDSETALWSSLLVLTTPKLIQWSWYTMTDFPALCLSLVSLMFFYRYTKEKQAKFLYWAVVVSVLAVWTKQTAAYLALVFLLFLLIENKSLKFLYRKEILLGGLIGILGAIPVVMITYWLGDSNISQALGTGSTGSTVEANPFPELFIKYAAYFYHLVFNQTTLPMLLLFISGLLWTAFNKDKRSYFFLCLFFGVYLFFTHLYVKNYRYTLFWIPAVAVFSALGINWIKTFRHGQYFARLLLVSVVFFQAWKCYQMPIYHSSGYKIAAKYVLEQKGNPVIFYDGFHDGYFTYFLRTLDPSRSKYLIRGDKILSSSSLIENDETNIHFHSKQDVFDQLKRFGVGYVVVEYPYRGSLLIHAQLRNLLQSSRFVLKKEIPVHSNLPRLENTSLRIYSPVNTFNLSADSLTLPLPLVGKVITVPFQGNGIK